MKIRDMSSIGMIEGQRRRGSGRKQEQAEPQDQIQDQVKLSGAADWISELRDEARRTDGVREDLVEQVQRQIAEGTLEQSVDWDEMIDRLLGDL